MAAALAGHADAAMNFLSALLIHSVSTAVSHAGKEFPMKRKFAAVLFGLALLVMSVAPAFASTGYAIGG